ncbi:MAG: hypothetical protein K2X99_03195 [Gemmatimonadaceae bacterium]|nr:hypothetical protein [Gemmatimonadaceae bacterium]
MTHPARPASRRPRTIAARTLLLAAIGVSSLNAQAPADSAAPATKRIRQTLSVAPRLRDYTVGATAVREVGVPFSYTLRSSRVDVRLDGASVRFEGATRTINGALPLRARLDLAARGGRDTLRFYASGSTTPSALDTAMTNAIGAVGTATLDLDAGSLGTPAAFGTRFATGTTFGEHGALRVRASLEAQSKPSTVAGPVFYSGTTWRLGGTLERRSELTVAAVDLDVTRSAADSLGGQNLFPGGGNLSLAGRIEKSFLDNDATIYLNGFYFAPFNNTRNDQPTRLIPQGRFLSLVGSAAIPLGALGDKLLLPTLMLLRESSDGELRTRSFITQPGIGGRPPITVPVQNVSTYGASGWTLSPSVALSFPIGRLDLTPEVGYAAGSVGATFSESVVARRGRAVLSSDQFRDRIRGWWTSVEFAVSW